MKPSALSRILGISFCFGLLVSCTRNRNEANAYRSLDSYEINHDIIIDNPLGFGEPGANSSLEKKYSSLLVFHADDTMEVKKVYTAALALARNAALDPIIKTVLDNSAALNENVIKDTTIELGKRMKAELVDLSPRDDPSFIIKLMGEGEQNMRKSKESIWQWSIEPLKEGPHKLMLSIQVIISDEDKINLPARNIPVIIFAKKVSFITKVGDFFAGYWQWIITGILLPIFIAWLTNSIKQKKEKKTKKKG